MFTTSQPGFQNNYSKWQESYLSHVRQVVKGLSRKQDRCEHDWETLTLSQSSFTATMNTTSSRLKRRWTSLLEISTQFKIQHLWWYGGVSVSVESGARSSGKETWLLKAIELLPSRQWFLFQGRPCIFQQDNAKAQTASISEAWLPSRRVLRSAALPAVQTCH